MKEFDNSLCKGCLPQNGCVGCDVLRLQQEHSKTLPLEHPFVDLVEEFHCQCDGRGDGCHECAGR